MNKLSSIVFTLLLVSQAGVCATDIEPELREALKVSSYEPNLFSIAGALILVIILIYITGLIYTKLNVLGAKTVQKQMKNYDLSKVTVLSTTALGQNKNLHVVEINDKMLLVGSTQNSINLIKDLSAQDYEQIVREVAKEDEAKAASEEKIEVEVQKPENDADDEFGLYKKYLK